MALAERIRKHIESQPVVTQAGPIQVTVSLGIAASIPPSCIDMNSLLQRADDALYRAKMNGRNRSEVAAPGSADSTPDVVGNGAAKF
jgi:diguanylate cyclase (GGDEF)-like protein